MCANSEGSGETARMRRLAWAFAGRLCDKYHNLMSWFMFAWHNLAQDYGNLELFHNHFPSINGSVMCPASNTDNKNVIPLKQCFLLKVRGHLQRATWGHQRKNFLQLITKSSSRQPLNIYIQVMQKKRLSITVSTRWIRCSYLWWIIAWNAMLSKFKFR